MFNASDESAEAPRSSARVPWGALGLAAVVSLGVALAVLSVSVWAIKRDLNAWEKHKSSFVDCGGGSELSGVSSTLCSLIKLGGLYLFTAVATLSSFAVTFAVSATIVILRRRRGPAPAG